MNNKFHRIMAIALIITTVLACGLMVSCGNSNAKDQTNDTKAEQQVAETDNQKQSDADEAKKAEEEEAAKKEAAAKKAEEDKAEEAAKAEEEAAKKAAEEKAAEEAAKEEAAAKEAAEKKSSKSSKSSASKKSSTKSSKKTETKTEVKAEAQKVCYVSVDNYCTKKQVAWEDGDTPFSVLKKTGATVSSRNSKYGVYVEGINGLFEFDKGDESGWKYKVNGKTIMDSAGDVKVSSGDTVTWYYVTEY